MDIDVYHCPNCDVLRGPSLSEYFALTLFYTDKRAQTKLPLCPNMHLNLQTLLFNALPQISMSSQPCLPFSPRSPRPSPPLTVGPVLWEEGHSLPNCIFLFFQTGGMGQLRRAQRADINRLIEWCCKPSTLIGQAPTPLPPPPASAPSPLLATRGVLEWGSGGFCSKAAVIQHFFKDGG